MDRIIGSSAFWAFEVTPLRCLACHQSWNCPGPKFVLIISVDFPKAIQWQQLNFLKVRRRRVPSASFKEACIKACYETHESFKAEKGHLVGSIKILVVVQLFSMPPCLFSLREVFSRLRAAKKAVTRTVVKLKKKAGPTSWSIKHCMFSVLQAFVKDSARGTLGNREYCQFLHVCRICASSHLMANSLAMGNSMPRQCQCRGPPPSHGRLCMAQFST